MKITIDMTWDDIKRFGQYYNGKTDPFGEPKLPIIDKLRASGFPDAHYTKPEVKIIIGSRTFIPTHQMFLVILSEANAHLSPFTMELDLESCTVSVPDREDPAEHERFLKAVAEWRAEQSEIQNANPVEAAAIPRQSHMGLELPYTTSPS